MFAGEAIEEVLSYLFYQIVEMMNQFTTTMSETGMSVLGDPNVKQIIYFFKMFGWSLWLVGAVYAVFEFCMAYQVERTSFYGTSMNLIKSLFAVSLFTVVPVALYNLSVDLHSTIGDVLTGALAVKTPSVLTLIKSFYESALNIYINTVMGPLKVIKNVWDFIAGTKSATAPIPFQLLVQVIIMLYVVIKVFIGNLKRGGIMLIMICTGALHMLSLPRGYSDGFSAWCKQVAALCFTVFMQNILFTLGLLMLNDSQATYVTLGIILSAAEVPRIAQMFGLETSAKSNIGGAMHTASSAFSMVKMVAR